MIRFILGLFFSEQKNDPSNAVPVINCTKWWEHLS